MLSIPKALEEKKNIPLREFISDVVMSRGNRRFLLTNLQAQIWGVTEVSEQTCSCVWTYWALSISYLTACCPDEYVPRPDARFMSILSCRVVCVFSQTDPKILVFSAHLFSFPGISFDFPYSIKLWFFLEYWNL
jgi:hypothetical protein